MKVRLSWTIFSGFSVRHFVFFKKKKNKQEKALCQLSHTPIYPKEYRKKIVSYALYWFENLKCITDAVLRFTDL